MNSSKAFSITFAMRMFALLAVICQVVKSEPYADHKVVQTNNGKVRGLLGTTRFLKKINYYSFKSIPFAKPPIGELRFKPPEPVESWEPEIIDAFEFREACVQPIIPGFANFHPSAEDCLFLSIYVPADVKPNEKLPVFLYIHGGGFSIGYGTDYYGPDFMLEQRVIVVLMQYRIGILGFMSLGTPEYSGNMGLKDQQLAMKWVHSNIGHFSGDNELITLAGTSAGSASAHYHVLSSESRKYFRRIIAMSGSAFNFWCLNQEKNHQIDELFSIAEDLEEPQKTVDELLAYLKQLPADEFGAYSDFAMVEYRTMKGAFLPVIESKDAVRPFIVDYPEQINAQTIIDKDMLFTMNSIEEITFYFVMGGELSQLDAFNSNFSLILPFRDAALPFGSPEYQEIAREIRQYYFKDATIDKKTTLKQYIDLLSDVNFKYGIWKSVKNANMSSNANVYLMQFSIFAALNFIKSTFSDGYNFSGSGHAEEFGYVFYLVLINSEYDRLLSNPDTEESQICIRLIQNISKLFANFIRYGNLIHDGEPIAEFPPVQRNKLNFLDISNDGLKLNGNLNLESFEFWANIEQKAKEKRKSMT